MKMAVTCFALGCFLQAAMVDQFTSWLVEIDNCDGQMRREIQMLFIVWRFVSIDCTLYH